MTAPRRIRDLVEVPPVKTVIRLADRFEMPQQLTADFVLTSEVARHLTILAEAFMQDTGKGCFLQGDFGSGKSHFLAALAAWLTHSAGDANLTDRHPGLCELRKTGRKFLVVDLALIDYRATSSLERLVILGIEQALRDAGIDCALSPLAAFLQHLSGLCENPSIAKEFAEQCGVEVAAVPGWIRDNPRPAFVAGEKLIRSLGLSAPEQLMEERHETFKEAMAAVSQAGFAGVVLLLDELSEFFRSKPDPAKLNEDARMLQLLGEFAAGAPLWIIAAVQESLERTGDIAQVTFRKIKDRFPLRLNLSAVHIRDLISRRLIRRKPGAEEEIERIFSMFKREFPSFRCDLKLFLSIYPVHPVTLELLEGLGDLFSQHRGIVDFVHSQTAGAPERNVPGILERPASELLAPDSIYEHFAPRLAEFSDFNIFPRHIVPHLDEVIADTVEDEDDRRLCRRLIRILVLYFVHPTASAPTLKHLTELVGCVLAPGQPELNLEFISEALLDPVAAASPFLNRVAGATGARGDVVYELSVEESPDNTLKERIEAVERDLRSDDTRILSALLPLLPESTAWPGPDITGADGLIRTVNWRQSSRQGLIRFCLPGDEESVRTTLTAAVTAAEADFGLVICPATVEFEPGLLPVAVWRLPAVEDLERVLRRWFAAGQVALILKPGNPADAPLIEPVREELRRLAPLAIDEFLKTFYRGGFISHNIALENAVLSLRRFERVVDAAAMSLLEKRYPRFAEIAPRGVAAAPRLFQRLLDEFMLPGRLSLQEARQRGLTAAIEGIAAPLGLVEVKAGAYLFAPDPSVQPLLKTLLSLLRPAAPTPKEQVYHELETGVFGMPRDTVTFLLSALAGAGLITLLRAGRSIPLDFLGFASVENCAEIAPGDLVGQPDRELLQSDCGFLAPPQGWDVFGLKQQREAWQALVAFKPRMEKLVAECRKRLNEVAGFSAFRHLDLGEYTEKLTALEVALAEIKTSYQARDGLERFLCGWRHSGLTDPDVTNLKSLHRFLRQGAESFIFLNHYLSHPAVEAAAANEPELAVARESLLERLRTPQNLFSEEELQPLNRDFESFRTAYTDAYSKVHDAYWRAQAQPALGRFARRILQLLQRLRSLEALEPPAGLITALESMQKPGREPCQRHVGEQLLRAPVCDCGISCEDKVESATATETPESVLERFLNIYVNMLAQAPVLEALEARAFALTDAAPEASARLRKLAAALREISTQPPGFILELLNDTALADLREALAGTVSIVNRSLAELTAKLGGRRLRPEQISSSVREWLGDISNDALVAIDNSAADCSAGSGNARAQLARLWLLSRSRHFPGATDNTGESNLRELEKLLDTALPAATLAKRMLSMKTEKLLEFMAAETCHTEAVRQAWLQVAERLLQAFPAIDIKHIPQASAHADPATAERISARLKSFKELAVMAGTSLPQRLGTRIHLATIAEDAWSTDALVRAAGNCCRQLEQEAMDWLQTLPFVAPIDPDTGSGLVVVIDGIAPDVWLVAAAELETEFPEVQDCVWARLVARPETSASIAALFELPGDPVEAFHARGIEYHNVTGKEACGLRESIPEPVAGSLTVLRVSCFDHDAHRGTVRLPEMPALLTDLCRRQLLPLADACRSRGLPVILTTDHGISYHRAKLTHGKGGVFEETVFRITLPAQ